MAIDVFISVGRTYNDEQVAFQKAFFDFLRAQGLEPHAVGITNFTSSQPLKLIEDLMNTCSGTVILAMERFYFESGIEYRDSDRTRNLRITKIPTIWNQIEAALAYGLNHPLLVIVEDGIRNEGLLEPNYDWYVKKISIQDSALHETEFLGVFNDWKSRVEQFSQLSAEDKRVAGNLGDWTISQLIGALKPVQLWGILTALATILAGVSIGAYKIGEFQTQLESNQKVISPATQPTP